MVVFGIMTKDNPVVEKYFMKWFNKYQDDVIGSKLMSCSLNGIKLDNNNILTVIRADFFVNVPFYWLGYATLLATFLIFGWSWFLLPGLLLSGTRLLFTSQFYHNSIRRGLKKAGYNDIIVFISSDDVVRKVLL